MGYRDINEVEFMDKPSNLSINSSLYELWTLGSLDDNQNLTNLGHIMSELPIDPRFARVILEGINLGCLNEVLIIISMLNQP
jgi:HrpA-like RNA helicase